MRHKMYEKTFKSTKKLTNRNNVTHNTKHTILIKKQNLLRTLFLQPTRQRVFEVAVIGMA